MSDRLRAIPSVEKVLQLLDSGDLPRPLVVKVVRRKLQTFREGAEVPALNALIGELESELGVLRRTRIQPVINGTGIVIHTNLGRSPLPAPVTRALAEVAANYTNLELNLETGERASRGAWLEELLALLCEAERATVVNNCAAALVLAVRHFTRTKPEVIISRGELIQIGGGFRIPEIIESSGAVLREVGTTNKTTLADYENALSERTGLILKIHHSNFRMSGFVESPARRDLSELAERKAIPFLEDLGSGALIRTEVGTALPHEPMPAEVLAQGVDLVAFSGDKLLGGPQAGILAGKKAHVDGLKREPLFRALRCDRLTLAALQATAELYLSTPENPPVLTPRLLRIPVEELRWRAEEMLLALTPARAKIRIESSQAEAGGGTLPESPIESVALAIVPGAGGLEELAAALRRCIPPIIGRIAGESFRLDLRTIFPEQDAVVVRHLKSLLA